MADERITRNREALERYFAGDVFALLRHADIASSISELNSSAYGNFVSSILRSDETTGGLSFFAITKSFATGSVRLWIRLCWLWLMKYRIRGLLRLHADRHAAAAEIIFAGHVAEQQGRFVAKDFTNFIDSYPAKTPVAILGQRLPHVLWRDYLASHDFIPIEAHLSFMDAARVWIRYAHCLLILLRHCGNPAVIAEYVRDFSAGRGPNSMLYACAAVRLIQRGTGKSRRLFLPLERHDWECLMLHFLKQRSPETCVFLVQNCTFSVNDTNMYAASGAPDYRRRMPDGFYVIDTFWQNRLMEMGLSGNFTIMMSHRFSDYRESVRFDRSSRKLLYLGSINPDKVEADFKALETLPAHCQIDVRMHPSLSAIPLPTRFKRVSEIADAYRWCIHADTSMAVFLKANEDRFIYIDHPKLLNQNPLPAIDRQGRNCPPEQLPSIVES